MVPNTHRTKVQEPSPAKASTKKTRTKPTSRHHVTPNVATTDVLTEIPTVGSVDDNPPPNVHTQQWDCPFAQPRLGYHSCTKTKLHKRTVMPPFYSS